MKNHSKFAEEIKVFTLTKFRQFYFWIYYISPASSKFPLTVELKKKFSSATEVEKRMNIDVCHSTLMYKWI